VAGTSLQCPDQAIHECALASTAAGGSTKGTASSILMTHSQPRARALPYWRRTRLRFRKESRPQPSSLPETTSGALQIGIGTSNGYEPKPVRVPGIANVATIYLCNLRSYIVRADGTLWISGSSYSAQGILAKNLAVPTRLDLPGPATAGQPKPAGFAGYCESKTLHQRLGDAQQRLQPHIIRHQPDVTPSFGVFIQCQLRDDGQFELIRLG
jgi:hypothetical protein